MGSSGGLPAGPGGKEYNSGTSVQRHRRSLASGWWLPAALLALVLLFTAAKLAVRSAATGQPILPGVASAPIIGPPPTATPTPGPPRTRLRVQVTDESGGPVPQALVEVRDRFNAVLGTQETGATGEAVLFVPAGTGYSVTVRKVGVAEARVDAVEAAPRSTAQEQSIVQVRLAAAPGLTAASDTRSAPSLPSTPATGRLGPRLYVGHTTPRISLIDAASNLLLKHSDALGDVQAFGQRRPTLLAYATALRRLFATWAGSTDVLVLNPDDLSVERRVPLGSGGITSIAVNPQTGRLWAYALSTDTPDSGTLYELDAAAEQVARRVPLQQATAALRFRPDGGVLFVPDRSTNQLVWLDPLSASPLRTTRLQQWPSDIAFSPDGTTLYLANAVSDRISVIDAAGGTPRGAIEVGPGATALAAHPDGKRLLAVNQFLGYVQVIDLAGNQVADLIPVGRAPAALALAPGGTTLYVANSGSGSVSVVDLATDTVRETLATGGSPASLLLVPAG